MKAVGVMDVIAENVLGSDFAVRTQQEDRKT